MQPEIKFRREEKSAKRPALEHMKRRIELGKKQIILENPRYMTWKKNKYLKAF